MLSLRVFARSLAAAWVLAAAGAASAAWPGVPHDLGQSLTRQKLLQDEVALVAVPVGGGSPLVSLNADALMNPASTMKLLTGYAALSSLGPGYRWRTGAYLAGTLEGDTLRGDLVLKGGGDPKLVIEDLTEFVGQMRRAGLRVISGNLLLDDANFDLDARSVEQFDGDPYQPYNVRPYGMMMNFKATRFVVSPSGNALTLALDPALAGVELENDIRPAPGACRYGAGGLAVRVAGTEHKPLITVSGPYSPACGEQSMFAAVLTHRQFIDGLFKAAWRAAGGQFNGDTRSAPGAARGTAWIEWVSPRTLADVVQDINKFSNNVMTRQVLLQAASVGTGRAASVETARAWLRDWLAGNGLVLPGLVIDNGSGLSRQERITASGMARVLQAVAASPLADTLRGSLPLVGVDGTMRNRLVGDPVAGRAWIKTGSLNDVRAMAGFVDAQSGKRYVAVMFINGQRAALSQAAQDAFLRWVYQNG